MLSVIPVLISRNIQIQIQIETGLSTSAKTCTYREAVELKLKIESVILRLLFFTVSFFYLFHK